jgi:hypothetical protein
MKLFFAGIILLTSFSYKECIIPPGNSNAILSQEYKDQKINGRDLTIIQLFDDPVISDDIAASEITGDIDKEHSGLFIRNFTTAFIKSKYFKSVNYSHIPYKNNLVERKLVLNYEDTMKIFLPKEGSLLSADTGKSGLILFIDDLRITKTEEMKGGWMGNMKVGAAPASLYQIMNFALWDNDKGRVIAYGKVDDYSNISSKVSKSDWASDIKGIAEKILSYGTF